MQKKLDSHGPVIRAGFGIAHFVFFIRAIGIARQSQAALAQFKAGIEPADGYAGLKVLARLRQSP